MGQLRGLFRFQNVDSTKDLNDRFSGLVVKGVFDPGATHPSGAEHVTTPVVARVPGQLAVNVQAFMAVGTDGMVVVHDAPPSTLLGVTASITQYILVKSVYQPAGPADVQFEVRSVSDWNALTSSEKAKRVILAKVTAGVSEIVDDGDIDLRENDIIDKFNRYFIRGVVQTNAMLPIDGGTSVQRVQNGDVYLVIDDRQFWRWNEDTTSWETVTDQFVATDLALHKGVNGPSTVLTGTVATTNLAAGVVGTGTLFTTELTPGDSVQINGDAVTYVVLSIADNLHLTLTSAYTGSTAGGKAITKVTLNAENGGTAITRDIEGYPAHVAAAIKYTPFGGGFVVATNVQDAITEIDLEKVKKAGDTMTGQLIINTTGALTIIGTSTGSWGAQFIGFNGGIIGRGQTDTASNGVIGQGAAGTTVAGGAGGQFTGGNTTNTIGGPGFVEGGVGIIATGGTGVLDAGIGAIITGAAMLSGGNSAGLGVRIKGGNGIEDGQSGVGAVIIGGSAGDVSTTAADGLQVIGGFATGASKNHGNGISSWGGGGSFTSASLPGIELVAEGNGIYATGGKKFDGTGAYGGYFVGGAGGFGHGLNTLGNASGFGLKATGGSAAASLPGTGTVATTSLGSAVVGTTTLFTTEFAVGDIVVFDGDSIEYMITTITNNLNLTIAGPYIGSTAGGKSIRKVASFGGHALAGNGTAGNADAGAGFVARGGSKNGTGLDGYGGFFVGGGTTGAGLHGVGGSTSGRGVEGFGSGTGSGGYFVGGATAFGLEAYGQGSAAGINALGGASGGTGIVSFGGVNGIGIFGGGAGTGIGVSGAGGGTNDSIGVYGISTATNGYGIWGDGKGTRPGVIGVASSNIASSGVVGQSNSSGTDGTSAGVYGFTAATAALGVHGDSQNTNGIAVLGTVSGFSGQIAGKFTASGSGGKAGQFIASGSAVTAIEITGNSVWTDGGRVSQCRDGVGNLDVFNSSADVPVSIVVTDGVGPGGGITYSSPTFTVAKGTYRVTYHFVLDTSAGGGDTNTIKLLCAAAEFRPMTSILKAASGKYTVSASALKIVSAATEAWVFNITNAGTQVTVLSETSVTIERIPTY